MATIEKQYAEKLDTNEDHSITAPAADRNKEPIFDVLKPYLEQPAQVLEVASGTGQHVTFFANRLPHVTWQPTDIDDDYLRSISSYVKKMNLENVKPPQIMDVTKPLESYPFLQPGFFDMILNCNMIHISPWETSLGIFNKAGQLLKDRGLLVLYGPFRINGVLAPESNMKFDERLRSQDPSWGVRDTSDLEMLASQNRLIFQNMVDMPANNKCLIYRKCGPSK